MKVAVLTSAVAGGGGIAAKRVADALGTISGFEVDILDMGLLGGVAADVSPAESGSNGRITNTHYTVDYGFGIRQWVVEYLSGYDLLNVHWSSYLLSLAELSVLAQRGQTLLFTLHDFYYITGGCHYPAGCKRYLSSCSGCPQIDRPGYGYLVEYNALQLKRKIFSHPNVLLSAPSRFIVDSAITAGIVPAQRTHVLRNPYMAHRPFENLAEPGLHRILVVADSFEETRKGLSLAIDSMVKLADTCPVKQRLELHLVGRLDSEVAARLDGTDVNVVTHGHLSDHSQLVAVFRLCSYVLTCSYEDNWPNILVEAGAYGCRPVVGPYHGCEEFARSFPGGVVADEYSGESFALALLKAILSEISDGGELRASLAEAVRKTHDPQRVARSYLKAINSSEDAENVEFQNPIVGDSAQLLRLLRGHMPTSIHIETIADPFGSVKTGPAGRVVYTEKEESGVRKLLSQGLVDVHEDCYGMSSYRLYSGSEDNSLD